MTTPHPPAPKCIERKLFLLALDSGLPCQDYHLQQPHKTLAYTQALQHWAEKANPCSPNNLCQLAKCVQELREAMKPFMTFHNHEVLGEEVAGQETPVVEVKGAALPGTPPTTQLTLLVTQPSTPLIAPAAQPATTQKAKGAMSLVPSNWTEIHQSHPAAPVGCIPPTLGNLRWCHCSCSSSCRRRACHQIEGQLRGDQDDSSPASSQDSPK